jgi:hypothetical protein
LACLLADSELEDSSNVLVSQRGGRAGLAPKTFAGLLASPGDAELDDF